MFILFDYIISYYFVFFINNEGEQNDSNICIRLGICLSLLKYELQRRFYFDVADVDAAAAAAPKVCISVRCHDVCLVNIKYI